MWGGKWSGKWNGAWFGAAPAVADEQHKGRLPIAWGETDRLAMIRRDDEEILLMIGAFLEIHHG